VRVGEKETSEQAAIVERYGDLFSPGQLDALREAESAAVGDARERLYRLRKTCEGGLVAAELAAREDELENRILAARVTWRGEELPLRTAQAKLAVLPEYGDREELGALHAAENETFNGVRRELLAAGETLEAELSGSPTRSRGNAEEKGISLHDLERALDAASRASATAYEALRERWFGRLLGPARDPVPDVAPHELPAAALAARGDVHRERAVPVCAETLRGSGSTSSTSPGSGSTSTTARRSRRGHA
jgi:hypothetical protein